MSVTNEAVDRTWHHAGFGYQRERDHVNWPTKIWLNVALKPWDRFTMYLLTWEELIDQLK